MTRKVGIKPNKNFIIWESELSLILQLLDDEKHRLNHEAMTELKNDIEKVKKWCAEIKSDLKVYVDLTMKGK